MALRLEADGPLGKLAVRKLRAEERTIALAGKQVPKEIQWPVTAAQEVALVLNALDTAAPVEILSGSFVAPGVEVTTLKGRVDASGDKNDIEIAGSLEPAAVAAITPGYLKGMTVASGPGPFALTLRRALMAPEVAANLLRNTATGHAIDISASDIRMRIAEGLGIRYLVPEPVEMYIAEHRLYGMSA